MSVEDRRPVRATLGRILCAIDLEKSSERAGVRVRVEEQHGDPAEVIVLHATSRKVDLVVLGSNRRRGWRRFKEGSVGERVLRRAAWPVVMVPWDAPRAGVLEKKRRSPHATSRRSLKRSAAGVHRPFKD